MSEKTPGTVASVSKNKVALAVSNDEGWTVVELLGSEGEIEVGDTVFGDWQAVGGEDLHGMISKKRVEERPNAG
jgi:hypothetical protein